MTGDIRGRRKHRLVLVSSFSESKLLPVAFSRREHIEKEYCARCVVSCTCLLCCTVVEVVNTESDTKMR